MMGCQCGFLTNKNQLTHKAECQFNRYAATLGL